MVKVLALIVLMLLATVTSVAGWSHAPPETQQEVSYALATVPATDAEIAITTYTELFDDPIAVNDDPATPALGTNLVRTTKPFTAPYPYPYCAEGENGGETAYRALTRQVPQRC